MFCIFNYSILTTTNRRLNMNIYPLHLKTPLLKKIGSRYFQFWLWLHLKLERIEQENHRVYDHWGVIDTLGSDMNRTNWTRSYSEEGYSLYSIRIPFTHKWVTLVDGAWEDQTFVIETYQYN